MRATLDSGYTTETVEQVILGPIASDGDPVRPRRFHRFTVHDQGWHLDNQQRVNKRYPSEKRAINFASNGSATLVLPPDLTGRYEVRCLDITRN